MAQQIINIGGSAEDHTGDGLRVGGDKINDNFTELYDKTQNLGNNGNRFILFGDSVLARSNVIVVPTSIARSSNIATVTKVNHGVVAGQKIRVTKCTPTNFNGVVTVLTRPDANTFTYSSIGDDGAATVTSAFILVHDQLSGQGIWTWLNSKFNGGLNLIRNCSEPGDSTANALIRIDEVYQLEPTHVIVQLGINDIIATSPAITTAQIKANLESIIDGLLSKNIQVWLLAIAPLGSGHANYNAANSVKIIEINRWMKYYAAQKLGVMFCPVYDTLIDPVSVNKGSALTTPPVLLDGIHYNVVGARRAAQVIYATAIANGSSFPEMLTASNADNYANDTNSTNTWDYAPWVNTTGGSVTGTITGDVAANWSVGESGGGSGVGSIVARSDGFGYDQQIVFTPSADNDFVYAIFPLTAGRFVVGDTVQFAMQVSISGVSGSNLKAIYIQLKQTVSGVSGYAYCNGNDSTLAADFGLTDDTFTLVTPPFTLLTGFSLEAQLRIYFKAAGTALTIKMGRVTAIKNMFIV